MSVKVPVLGSFFNTLVWFCFFTLAYKNTIAAIKKTIKVIRYLVIIL